MQASTSAFSIIALILSMAGVAFAAGPSRPEPPVSNRGELIVIKFVEGSDVRLRNGQLKSLSNVKLAGVEKVLAAWPGLTLSRVFSRPEEDLERDRTELKALGHDDLPDLNLFYHLRLPPGVDADPLLAELLAQELVEAAYLAPKLGVPVSESDQGYLEAAPGGIGARQVWALPGGSGSGVTIADVEFCWDTGHEDLSKATESRIVTYPGQSVVCSFQDHGTSVLGELIADRNSFGVTGIAYGANILMSPVRTCAKPLGFCLSDTEIDSAADAINRAFDRLQPGDVILVEVQIEGPNYNPDIPNFGWVPVEWTITEYAAIKYATSRGVIVVEPAGNGEQNLDDAVYDDIFDRTSRDSGAIMVGAGAPPGYDENGSPVAARSKLNFSNYGSRVDVQGWGRRVATTTASGPFSNSGYTTDFGGTSSASPMVAAAAAIVQAHRKALGQAVLTPLAMRDLLAGTGVRQAGTGGHIGPQVDIAAAIRTLDTRPTITSASLAAPGCKGSSSRQWITLQGTGFVLASRVILNDGATNYEIPADRTEFLDDQTPPQLRVCAGVSFAPNWTAKVKNLTYQTSAPFAFTVGGAGPSVSLTATPTSISLGSSATLSWSSANTTSCTASGGWSGTKATSGSQTVSPSGTTTYTLTCSSSSSTASDSETVTVTGGSAAPIVLIDAFPETIAPGSSAGLAWATANATSCTASGGWSGSKLLTGSQVVNPSSTTTYTLTCNGPGGNAADSQMVTVSSSPYVSVVARPEAISPGGSSTLFWSTVNMSSCTASGGWSGSKALSGTQTVSPSSTTTYTLTCTETSGGTSELIRNGAFAGTVSQWSKSGSFFADSRYDICKSCPGYAYLSDSGGSIGASNNLVGWISQDFSIPSSATSVLLSFWVSISTQETTTSTVFDSLLVWLKDTSGNPLRTLVGLSNLDAGGYRQIFANLTSERGRTVRLEFLGATDATRGTVFRIDDVSVVATLPGAQRSDSATLTVLTPRPPAVSLTASPDSIAPGESSTLSWSSSEVTSCTASGGWSGSKSPSGNQSVSPTATTTYTLTCTGAGGSASASATVALRQAAPALTLTATPSSILQGASSNLTWNATNATSCVAAGAWEGSRPTSGSETVAPQATSSYVLICQGSGGSATREATVTVLPHTVTFTSGPSGSPNPVASGGVVAMDAQATDSHGHALTWSWLSSCPGANGTFSSSASRTPIWTAPANTTDEPFDCLISVTASDGQGLSATASYLQEIGTNGPSSLQGFFLDSSRQGCSGSGPAVLLWWTAPAGMDNVFTVRRTDDAYSATVNSSQEGKVHLVSSLLVPGEIYSFRVEGTLNGTPVQTNAVTVPVISDECRLPVGTGELPHLPLVWTGTPFCSGGTASVPLQWTAVVGADSYTLTRIDNVAGQLTPYPGLDSTSMTDTGLIPGAAYEYMLEAVGSGGGRRSTRISVFVPSALCGGEPSTPGPFSAQVSTPVCDAGKGAVPLSWTPASGAASGTHTYWSDDGFTSGSGSTFTGSSKVIDGIRPGALVKLMVQAEAAATPLQYRSVILAQRIPLDICGGSTLPPAVNTVAATYIQERQALLRASVIPNADSSIAHFEWGTSPSFGSTTPMRNAGNGYRSASLGETLTGLACNTTYYFRGRAANPVGQNSGTTLQFTTKPCSTSLPVVTVTATDLEASEQPLRNGEFLIQRLGSTASDLTVLYSVGGTATVGQDHTLAGGSVVIPAGSSGKTLAVAPLDDQVAEGDETVVVTLQGQPHYQVGQPGSATVMIASDEVAGGGGCGNILVQQPRDEFGGCDTAEAGVQRVAENFRLADRRKLACLEILGYYWPNNDPPPTSIFDVVIHGVANDGAPGTVLHENRGIRVQRQKTGTVSFGLEEWRFTIELPNAVELAAGNYFAEVIGSAPTDGSVCWIGGRLDPVAGLNGMVFDNTGQWSLGTWDLAFKLFEAKTEIFVDGFESGTTEKWVPWP